MKKITLLPVLTASLLLANSHAGDWGQAAYEAAPETGSSIYGSVSAGYETDYIFRGGNFGSDAPWGEIDLNYDLSEQYSLNAGVWYIDPTSNPSSFSELDLYAFVTRTMGDLSVSVGGTWFYYDGQEPSAGEIGVEAYYSLGFVDLGGIYYYDYETEGHYYEANLGKEIDLSDQLLLGLATGVGFGKNYYDVTGSNHAFVTAGLSYFLTDAVTFDVYVGGNFPLGDLADFGEEEQVHGGASVSIGF